MKPWAGKTISNEMHYSCHFVTRDDYSTTLDRGLFIQRILCTAFQTKDALKKEESRTRAESKISTKCGEIAMPVNSGRKWVFLSLYF
jgi:hypothetical protein